MNPLLTLLNHLLAAALQERRGQGAVQLRSMTLDEDGARLVLWLEHAQAGGEAIVRLRADPPAGDTQKVTLRCERLPDRLSAALEPFRELAQQSRVTIELDYSA